MPLGREPVRLRGSFSPAPLAGRSAVAQAVVEVWPHEAIAQRVVCTIAAGRGPQRPRLNTVDNLCAL